MGRQKCFVGDSRGEFGWVILEGPQGESKKSVPATRPRPIL
jgi:hypothetical protein